MTDKKIPVLNAGYVQLITEGIVPKEVSKIAGISRRDGVPKIKDLISWGHESPMEFSFWIFKVKAPIFVLRQWFRHRTGKYMEESLRYCTALQDYYVPEGMNEYALDIYENAMSNAFRDYRRLLLTGMPEEQARSVIPLGIYSTAYVGFDIRNLRHFIKLRDDKHAQKEIREYAKVIKNLLPKEFTYWEAEDV